jgi:maltoporin
MRMPLLPMPSHPSATPTSRPRARGLLLGLAAGVACLGVGNLSAQTSDAELAQLKAQMQQMQEDYAKRLGEMEVKMKSMEAQVALSAGIAQSRAITGPDGKEIDLKGGPVVIPALDTFTRNFKWHGYARIGTGFTSNGVGQTFNFNMPDTTFGTLSRLGNENNIYIETGPILSHMLGDDPDVVDAKFKMTFQIFDNVDKEAPVNTDNDGFGIGIIEAYFELKNVIKSAPEVTFWGGQRFYDRYNIDSSDYFWLNTSGVGAGVYNIPLGPGSLQLAYFGAMRSGTGAFFLEDDTVRVHDEFNNFTKDVNSGTGEFYRHVFDVRWGDIDFLWGKLKLVAIGSYMQGGDFTIDYANGTTGNGHINNSGGAGGGIVQQWDLPPSWGKLSFVQAGLLYGWGLVDFDPSAVPLGTMSDAYLSALAADGNAPRGTFEDINPFNNSQQGRANVYWVWNPTDNFSMGTWASYKFDDQGFTAHKVNTDGSVSSTSGKTHLFSVGIRPVYWLWGPFAIQASAAYTYLSNNRSTGAGFGDSGSLGIITIAPTIKPRGGFFTRPELRAFATFAAWSKEFQGAIGTPAYAKQNYGWMFGVQAEAWW